MFRSWSCLNAPDDAPPAGSTGRLAPGDDPPRPHAAKPSEHATRIIGHPKFFEALATIVIASAWTALVARWLKLPSIVSQVGAGLVFGPATGMLDGFPEHAGGVAVFGEMSIVRRLFVVGLAPSRASGASAKSARWRWRPALGRSSSRP